MNNFEHIYIHWPFCRSKCFYCDFLSFCNLDNLEQEYNDSLCSQVKSFNNLNKNKIKTIFIGGGTPSIWPINLLEKFIIELNNNFDLSDVQEFTIEANPADITQEKLLFWRNLGINRLSMGVQVLDDNVLARVGRKQTVAQALNAINLAQKYFENISVDLILGLPGVDNIMWQKTLDVVVAWPIKHVSVYLLTLYKNTKLFDLVKKNEIFLLNDDMISDIYEKTVNFLELNNFMQYEISNFAKTGAESAHNMAYWDRRAYLGLGAGASSFDGKIRYINEKDINKYLKIKDNPLIYAQKENLTEQQVFLEKLMLALRTKKGGDLHSMLYFLSDEKKQDFLKKLNELKDLGLISITGGFFNLTKKGFLLENEIVLKLI